MRNAQRLGFSRDEEFAALTFLAAALGDRESDVLGVAMDLSRFVALPLPDAVDAMVKAMTGRPRGLRRFGIDLPADVDRETALALVRERVAGSAEYYAETIFGRIDATKAARS